jgi:DNA-binding XRE family transcriptional regulator
MNGNEFENKRIALELTQAQLAIELGIQADTVSLYETGDLTVPKTVELAMESLLQRMNDANTPPETPGMSIS